MTAPDGEHYNKHHEPSLDPDKELSGDASNEASDSDRLDQLPERVHAHKRHRPNPSEANNALAQEPPDPAAHSSDIHPKPETSSYPHEDSLPKGQPSTTIRSSLGPDQHPTTADADREKIISHEQTQQQEITAGPDAANVPPMTASTSEEGTKRFFCGICGQGFTRKHNMVSHELIHLSTKPHVCTVCDASFRRIHDLRRHAKLHLGEKPFHCPFCRRGFARTDALTRHSNSMNGCALRPQESTKDGPANVPTGPGNTAISTPSSGPASEKEGGSFSSKKPLKTSSASQSLKLSSPPKVLSEDANPDSQAVKPIVAGKEIVANTKPDQITRNSSSGNSSGITPNMDAAPGLSVSNPASASSSDESRNNLVDASKSNSYDVNRWRAMQQRDSYSAMMSEILPTRPSQSKMSHISPSESGQSNPAIILNNVPLQPNMPVSKEYHHHFYHHHHLDRGFVPNKTPELLNKGFQRDSLTDELRAGMIYGPSDDNRRLQFPPFSSMDGRSGLFRLPNQYEALYWVQQEQERQNARPKISSEQFGNFANMNPQLSGGYRGINNMSNPREFQPGRYGEPVESQMEGNGGLRDQINFERSKSFAAYSGNQGKPAKMDHYGPQEMGEERNAGRPDNAVVSRGDPLTYKNVNAGGAPPTTNSGSSSNWATLVNSGNSGNPGNSGNSQEPNANKRKSGHNPRGFVSMRSYNELVDYTHSLQNSLSTMEDRILALENDQGRKEDEIPGKSKGKP